MLHNHNNRKVVDTGTTMAQQSTVKVKLIIVKI